MGMYIPPTGASNSTDPYVGKTPTTAGSKVPPGVFNWLQNELQNLILAAQLTPTMADFFQVLRAIRDGRLNYYVDGGSSNSIIIAPNPAIPVLAAGMLFRVKVAATNTGASTGTVNANTPAPIVRNEDGSALKAGDLVAGTIVALEHDGTNLRLHTLPSAAVRGFKNQVVFKTAGTFSWSVPAGVTQVYCELWAAGGGGGGAGGSNSAAAGGSGAGGEKGFVATVPGATMSVVVGAAGAAGLNTSSVSAAPNNGGNGGSSSFGTLSATGGQGGGGSYTGNQGVSTAPGVGSGGNISATGQRGMTGFIPSGTAALGGAGGSAAAGGGGGGSASTGQATDGYAPGGGGGGGGATWPGGAGAAGAVILWW